VNKIFPTLLFVVSILIAGTAAFFSVKGIGLLFAGSFMPVVVMASSLEIGKLFAVSFLYRKWYVMPFMLKFYLSIAVLLLIAITSLGIFGFLSDAYQDTKNKVNYIDTKITSIENQNKEIQLRIKTTQGQQQDKTDNNSVKSERYKQIYDSYVELKNKDKQSIMSRMSQLDQMLNDVKNKPGGLFSNKKKEIETLTTQQQPERDKLNNQLDLIESDIKKEYDNFLAKVDSLSELKEKKPQVDVKQLYAQLEDNNKQILELKGDIHKTDIGSFKFIAQAVDVEVDTAVKWFIAMIVIVFDPLAMCLIIGYNIYATGGRKFDTPTSSVIPTASNIKDRVKQVVFRPIKTKE